MQSPKQTSTIGKQILGAVIGMSLAGGAYYAMNSLSTNTLSGLLVGTVKMSDNPSQIRVSNMNLDDNELRGIATRARMLASEVAKELGTAELIVESEPTMVTRAFDRKEERKVRFVVEKVEPNNQVAAQITATDIHSGAPKRMEIPVYEPVQEVNTNRVVPPSNALPNAGLGTSLALVLAFIGSLVVMRKKILARA